MLRMQVVVKRCICLFVKLEYKKADTFTPPPEKKIKQEIPQNKKNDASENLKVKLYV